MATTTKTKLAIESWDEKPYREPGDGTKFARAEVALAGTDEGFAGTAAFESLLYYDADGTSTYVTVMRLEGTLAGRRGTLVLQGSGTFDGTTARMLSTIIAATDDLAGATGGAESVSTHADYPNMPLTLTYSLG